MAQTWQPNAGDDYYDIPQILKRLEWLDAERRKDKDAIFLLQEQITHLKAILEKANPMHLSGRLHMEDFSADNPRATFEVDDE